MSQPSLPCQGGRFGVADCISELLVSKSNANRTDRYVRSLGHYLNQFIKGRENQSVYDFTVAEVEAWLGKYSSSYTKQTWLNRLSALFSFCVRRGYMESNPCDRVERITVDKKPPVVLSPGQSQELLKACPTMIRPYLILGMYAGIRPEEIQRTDWSAINLENKTVLVNGKTRRLRLVTLEPIAVKLLTEHPLKSGPVAPSNTTLDKWRVKSRKLLGFDKWPQDLLRHTAASYLLALHQNAGKVALLLGNSEKILLSHYHNPVKDEDSKNFWGVCQTTSANALLGHTPGPVKLSVHGQTQFQNHNTIAGELEIGTGRACPQRGEESKLDCP